MPEFLAGKINVIIPRNAESAQINGNLLKQTMLSFQSLKGRKRENSGFTS